MPPVRKHRHHSEDAPNTNPLSVSSNERLSLPEPLHAGSVLGNCRQLYRRISFTERLARFDSRPDDGSCLLVECECDQRPVGSNRARVHRFVGVDRQFVAAIPSFLGPDSVHLPVCTDVLVDRDVCWPATHVGSTVAVTSGVLSLPSVAAGVVERSGGFERDPGTTRKPAAASRTRRNVISCSMSSRRKIPCYTRTTVS